MPFAFVLKTTKTPRDKQDPSMHLLHTGGASKDVSAFATAYETVTWLYIETYLFYT